jgi:hypothetical protein
MRHVACGGPLAKEASNMHFVSRKLALFLSLGAATVAPSACHIAQAADPPRTITPSIDVEVEDRAPDKSLHIARFTLSIHDGNAEVKTHDGEAAYVLEARNMPSTDPHFSLKLKRSERNPTSDIELSSAIPLHAGPRLLVAKIDRADGHLTSVVAQVH